MKHVHAELMLEYAKDAAEIKDPWTRWGFRKVKGEWTQLTSHPKWDTKTKYKRLPKTLEINGIAVPEPVTDEPKRLEMYYSASIESFNLYEEHVWGEDEIDLALFERGLIHRSREDAISHARALLSFTTKEK